MSAQHTDCGSFLGCAACAWDDGHQIGIRDGREAERRETKQREIDTYNLGISPETLRRIEVDPDLRAAYERISARSWVGGREAGRRIAASKVRKYATSYLATAKTVEPRAKKLIMRRAAMLSIAADLAEGSYDKDPPELEAAPETEPCVARGPTTHTGARLKCARPPGHDLPHSRGAVQWWGAEGA